MLEIGISVDARTDIERDFVAWLRPRLAVTTGHVVPGGMVLVVRG